MVRQHGIAGAPAVSQGGAGEGRDPTIHPTGGRRPTANTAHDGRGISMPCLSTWLVALLPTLFHIDRPASLPAWCCCRGRTLCGGGATCTSKSPQACTLHDESATREPTAAAQPTLDPLASR